MDTTAVRTEGSPHDTAVQYVEKNVSQGPRQLVSGKQSAASGIRVCEYGREIRRMVPTSLGEWAIKLLRLRFAVAVIAVVGDG